MQCDVCHRTASSKLPFNCTTCARDILYQPRLKHAQLLLEKESIEKQVERSIKGSAKSSSSSAPEKQGISPAWIVRRASAEKTTCEEQTETIHSHIQVLRQETQAMKADIAARRRTLQQKRLELVSAQQELSNFQNTAPEPLTARINKINYRWGKMHAKIAEGRLFLCREVADLYNLQHHRRKKGVKGRDIYTIGGVPITDLRDLNTASPTDLTVSLNHIAHLVHLTSHYLSLKLPAEITLPHNDYPRPTIFSPTSSYTTTRPLPYPGTTPSQSPSASRHKETPRSSTTPPTTTHPPHPHKPTSTHHPNPPRARILHLDRPLPTLAKDDLPAHDSFVEATTFLAWNIAWLCRTQGLPVASSNWDDLCAVGKNLYHLLLPPPPRPTPSPTLTPDPTTLTTKPTTASPAKPAISQATDLHSKPQLPPQPGTYSHTTTYAFLAAAPGAEYMRTWRLASAVKAVERVKAMLVAERTGAEWEILEGGEWEGAEDVEGGVGGGVGGDGVGELAKVKSLDEEGVGEEGGKVGEKEGGKEGRNGWMKVKSRSASTTVREREGSR